MKVKARIKGTETFIDIVDYLPGTDTFFYSKNGINTPIFWNEIEILDESVLIEKMVRHEKKTHDKVSLCRILELLENESDLYN